MRKMIFSMLIVAAFCPVSLGVKISSFPGTDTYIKRAQDIIVAKCVSIPNQERMVDGVLVISEFELVDVDVLKVLKGDRKTGPLQIATIYPMKPETTYMLYNLGGSAMGTDFLAVPELSVVPLPANFKIEELDNKDLKDQVQYLFSRYLLELENRLAPLLAEQKLYQSAISDRQYELYDSNGPVKLSQIKEIVTQTNSESEMLKYLEINGEKIKWSNAFPGKNGYFYFSEIDKEEPCWEFAISDVNSIEELEGKVLKTKFYGLYTPGKSEAGFDSLSLGTFSYNRSDAVIASAGQVLLARNIKNLKMIYVIQIVEQERETAQMKARYAVINQ